MRVPHHRFLRTLSIGTLALTGVLLVPAHAFAASSAPTDQHRDAPIGEAPCPDFLVTQYPTGTDGETSAVAITAQALDAGLPGWSNVAWEAAPGIVINAVQAADVDGQLRSLPATSSGGAEGGVTALRFCGTSAPRTGADDVEVVGAQFAGGTPTADTTADAGFVIATAGFAIATATAGPAIATATAGTTLAVATAHAGPAATTADATSATARIASGTSVDGTDTATGAGPRRSSASAFGFGALAGLLVLLARRRAEHTGGTRGAGTPRDLPQTPDTARAHADVQASITEDARRVTRRRLAATTRESFA